MRRVPEGPSNIEIAHHVGEHEAEESEERKGLSSFGVEIGEAVLLAIVAIATAWSGYQSALWDGQSAKLYGTSSRIRVQATQNETRGGQQQLYDATTFNFWLQAKVTGDSRLVKAYQNRFRLEYRPAFYAWLATDPFHNPHAPPAPAFMPQYHNSLVAQSKRQNKQATEVFAQAAEARETGDKYVRTTVLLATVLFLIAVSQRFKAFRVRIGILVVALALLAIALVSIARYHRL